MEKGVDALLILGPMTLDTGVERLKPDFLGCAVSQSSLCDVVALCHMSKS